MTRIFCAPCHPDLEERARKWTGLVPGYCFRHLPQEDGRRPMLSHPGWPVQVWRTPWTTPETAGQVVVGQLVFPIHTLHQELMEIEPPPGTGLHLHAVYSPPSVVTTLCGRDERTRRTLGTTEFSQSEPLQRLPEEVICRQCLLEYESGEYQDAQKCPECGTQHPHRSDCQPSQEEEE